jgi:diacylglycerol O-acyltransferase
MKRLSGTDALFLSMETPAWHQHVGGLTILEPGSRQVTFERVLDAIEQRLDGAPKFRWKIRSMPFDLDRPVWVDDEQFDIRRHVHRIGVPAPGGARETAEIAGTLLSSPLDRRRPLWELWFLEGLASGRVGMLMKYHHCLLDGVSGASLATVLMDIERDATEPAVPFPPPEERTAGAEPSPVDLLARVATEAVQRPFRWGRYLVRGTRKLLAGADVLRRDYRPLLGPVTPFNASIGPRRALSFTSVSMDDVKALKAAHGVKVNDIVLAVVGGALRRYLVDIDELPEASLVSAVPVSTRPAGDTTQDNQVSFMSVGLGTDIAEPVERLHEIHAAAQTAKAMQQAISAREIQSLGEVASPLVLSTALRTLYQTRLVARLPAAVNTIVSNVPGPAIPVYSCGAEVTGIFPCSVIMEGMGINVTVISYMDRVDVGFHVDPDLVPDPWAVADFVPRELDELMVASGLDPAAAVTDPFGEPTASPEPRVEPGAGTTSRTTSGPRTARPGPSGPGRTRHGKATPGTRAPGRTRPSRASTDGPSAP